MRIDWSCHTYFRTWQVIPRPALPINRPMWVCIGVALGALPLMPALHGGSLALFGLLPLAVSAHILILARRMLFSPWRDGLKRAVVATTVALSVIALTTLDPSRASSGTIREHQAQWVKHAPDRYEFTVQLSGNSTVEALMPKRITVEHGKVISTNYIWDLDAHHKAGDSAPVEDLWTIDRAFTELLLAEERGWNVRARFNKELGFVENAEVSMDDGSNTVRMIEIRDFQVVAPAIEPARPAQRER